MKLSATFLDAIEKENEGGSSKENYLRYTKLTQGKPANFALLSKTASATGLSGAKRLMAAP